MSFLVVFRRLWQGIRRGWEDPVFRSLFALTAVLLLAGAFLYHRAEGWTLFQSLYFSVVTLATVGYGDLAPVTFAGRLFTIFYVLIGVGIIVAFISRIASHAAEVRAERVEERRARKRASED